jgi:hypothetical protein
MYAMCARQAILIPLVVSAQQDIIYQMYHLLPVAHVQIPTPFAFNVLMLPTAHFAKLVILELYAIHVLLDIKILVVELVLLDTLWKIFNASHVLVMFIFAASHVSLDLSAMFARLGILKELAPHVILDIMNRLTLHLLAHFVQMMSIATVRNVQVFRFALYALLDGLEIFAINVLLAMGLQDHVQHVSLAITLLVLTAILVQQILTFNVNYARLHQLVLNVQMAMMLLTIAEPALKDITLIQILKVSVAYHAKLPCLIV